MVFQNFYWLRAKCFGWFKPILEKKPEIIFLEIDPVDVGSNLSLRFIDTLHKYLTILPILDYARKEFGFDSFQYEVKSIY
jgi:hypothetical protein